MTSKPGRPPSRLITKNWRCSSAFQGRASARRVPRVPGLELGDEPGHRIGRAQDPRVLEDQGDGRARARPIGARREHDEGGEQERERRDAADQKLNCAPMPTVSHRIPEELAVERAPPVVLEEDLEIAAQHADTVELNPGPEREVRVPVVLLPSTADQGRRRGAVDLAQNAQGLLHSPPACARPRPRFDGSTSNR